MLISGFVSHLDLDWDDPRHAHFLDRLGTMGRLIRFDKRGTGMSDRPPGVPDLETRMHDVLAVMDAVGSERAVLVGYSEGGPMAMMMAAMHPERVQSLVLYGAYARRTWAEDYPWAQTQEDRERLHREPGDRVGLGGGPAHALPVGRQGDAAVVVPPDAGSGDARRRSAR